MNREQFDRIVRSVAQLTGEKDVLVVGSQAVLGWYPDMDDFVIVRSMELDVGPLDGSDRNIVEIAGVLGELSPFHESNGAYADGVSVEEIALLPRGWRDRLLRVEGENLKTPKGQQSIAWCLHPNDILVSKWAAGREKDFTYCECLVALNLPEVDRSQVECGLNEIRQRFPTKANVIAAALSSMNAAFDKLQHRLSHNGHDLPPQGQQLGR